MKVEVAVRRWKGRFWAGTGIEFISVYFSERCLHQPLPIIPVKRIVDVNFIFVAELKFWNTSGRVSHHSACLCDIQDFSIQSMERRISRLQGDMDNDDKQVLEEKIAQLNEELERKTTTKTMLIGQIKKLQVRLSVFPLNEMFCIVS